MVKNMKDYNELTINNYSIIPLIANNQTQILLQRHGDYNKISGVLTLDSKYVQNRLTKSFFNNLNDSFNTYFLFVASNTQNNKGYKRCVESLKIPMKIATEYFRTLNLYSIHVLNNKKEYYHTIKESGLLSEPQIFTDKTGYLEYLKEKHGGINPDFWIDFEEDQSQEIRKNLNAEGPDEIVDRSIYFIKTLQRYSKYFHNTHPNSKLFIWVGTHYDLISPLVKQKVLNWNKTDVVYVDYLGGISLILDDDNICSNINGITHPFDSPDNLQLLRRLKK